MKRCRVVPAIDLIDGRCVRLRQGKFSDTEVVGEDPVVVAKEFARQGYSRLHVVDLDGARSGSPRHLKVVRAITAACNLSIDLSGGLRTAENVEQALACGASQVVIGSAAILNPEEVRRWFSTFGPDAIILGLDLLQGEVRIKGWEEGSGRSVGSVVEQFSGCGLKRLMSTDISRDGTLEGPSVEMYASLCRACPSLEVIASGGVSCEEDIVRLAETGVREIIVGKALYAGRISPSRISEFVW